MVNSYEALSINLILWDMLDYANEERMTRMVERAAAAWYPAVEHMGLELARFTKAVVAGRGKRPASKHEL